jgi:hypothetical protein
MTKETYQNLTEQLRNFGENIGWILKETNRENFGMIQLSFEKDGQIFYYDNSNDPYFMDCVMVEEIKENPVVWNGIRYMNMTHFVADLIETLTSRHEKVQAKAAKFLKSKGNLAALITTVNSLDKFKVYVIEKLGDLKDTYIRDTLIDFVREYKPPKKLLNLGEIITDMTIDMNKVDSDIEDKYDEEGKEKPDHDKIDLENLGEHLSDIAEYFLLEGESNMVISKYRKTYVRAQNVAEITWEQLSDDYKRYLLGKCNGPKLDIFTVSQTCQAFLRCESHDIDKDTSGCFLEKEKHEQLYKETN